MEYGIILGTRPEIIKLSPVIRAFQQNKSDFFIIHSGQHYSYNLDEVFFEELKLPKPDYNLNSLSGTHAEQTAKIMIGVESLLLKENPNTIVIEGDTNTVLAAGLVASKLKLPIAHVEAGLRSFDRNMPEEINRVIVDHISNYLFAPTQKSQQNLVNEGIQSGVYVTGNTIVDSVKQHLELAKGSSILRTLQLEPYSYLLATVHRAENVDDPGRLESIFQILRKVQDKLSIPLVVPIHPRTMKQIELVGISTKNLLLTDPIGYLDFLFLESRAKLILTDSGGIQEEACILEVPCITLRDNTERPETVEVGANIVTGIDLVTVMRSINLMLEKPRSWKNPFGDGYASDEIARILTK